MRGKKGCSTGKFENHCPKKYFNENLTTTKFPRFLHSSTWVLCLQEIKVYNQCGISTLNHFKQNIYLTAGRDQ